jgi:hypothetical protein
MKQEYIPSDALKAAVLSMIGKFAEAHGVIEYVWKALFGKEMRAIFYK